MPKQMSQFVLREQPIAWARALICGVIGAMFMMAFIDTFHMMGLTEFSFETYIGSLLRFFPFGVYHQWLLGFMANLLFGAVFGLFYAYCFEYVFFDASARLGIRVGGLHAVAAALAFFPFFNIIHEFYRTDLYPSFGLLGSSLGIPTFILLLTGHLLFGSAMGTFYGPVREERVMTRFFEPGETGLSPEMGGISQEEDPDDLHRIAVS